MKTHFNIVVFSFLVLYDIKNDIEDTFQGHFSLTSLIYKVSGSLSLSNRI